MVVVIVVVVVVAAAVVVVEVVIVVVVVVVRFAACGVSGGDGAASVRVPCAAPRHRGVSVCDSLPRECRTVCIVGDGSREVGERVHVWFMRTLERGSKDITVSYKAEILSKSSPGFC